MFMKDPLHLHGKQHDLRCTEVQRSSTVRGHTPSCTQGKDTCRLMASHRVLSIERFEGKAETS